MKRCNSLGLGATGFDPLHLTVAVANRVLGSSPRSWASVSSIPQKPFSGLCFYFSAELPYFSWVFSNHWKLSDPEIPHRYMQKKYTC